jgi:hypothetical protein
LKNGGPNLVDALHEVIQQAMTSETIPRSWTEGVLCPVCKKGDKLDCKNYRGICLFNVTYKVFAKILYDRLFPTLTRPFSITMLGSNQVNQQQTNSLHCAKSEKNAMSLTSQRIISTQHTTPYLCKSSV